MHAVLTLPEKQPHIPSLYQHAHYVTEVCVQHIRPRKIEKVWILDWSECQFFQSKERNRKGWEVTCRKLWKDFTDINTGISGDDEAAIPKTLLLNYEQCSGIPDLISLLDIFLFISFSAYRDFTKQDRFLDQHPFWSWNNIPIKFHS